MQLFTIGLYELNLDGSRKLNANGEPIDTYNNETVRNLARVFTGWTATYTTEQSNKPMYLVEENHSLLEKSFLGITIPAGTQGLESLKLALKILFNHPNVGPFIGKQLIRVLSVVTQVPNILRELPMHLMELMVKNVVN